MDAHLRLKDAREGTRVVAARIGLGGARRADLDRNDLRTIDAVLLRQRDGGEAGSLREIADRDGLEEDRHDLRLAVEQANVRRLVVGSVSGQQSRFAVERLL